MILSMVEEIPIQGVDGMVEGDGRIKPSSAVIASPITFDTVRQEATFLVTLGKGHPFRETLRISAEDLEQTQRLPPELERQRQPTAVQRAVIAAVRERVRIMLRARLCLEGV